ncbi:BlaR1 family beta-lactam sensor/signal transducer [Mordavella massiliensis]|uniref:BlaR1 family beta-lactam sensor/signal transducer n=1 Tax=Mordavella massiliensis TaxID=1871024 RepID=UPI00210B2388|nr:BlaR1 family beta-lactam sensor/signal transducer [Mordavella massiliensis]
MTDFIIHFFICNLLISGMIGILFLLKKIWKSRLTSRTQYNLWFLPLCLMAVPFLPVRSDRIFSWFMDFNDRTAPFNNTVAAADTFTSPETASGWMNDFTVSVSSRIPSVVGTILFGIWIIGILAMILLVLRSSLSLYRIKKSALPLQNHEVRKLYKSCLEELHITRAIPIYSTAFLKSPVITGWIRPRIYLPIRLITDYEPEKIRYMLLHELQHYRHKDNLSNALFLAAQIFYWFNPLIWLAARAMRNDREVACDSAVLNMLHADSYQDYGYTLINFAEKISLSPFPFSSSLGGTIKQLEQRIRNIAAYKKPSSSKRLQSMVLFAFTAALFVGITPVLSSYAAADDQYQWDTSGERISELDLSDYFEQYDGSFVLYNLTGDQWSIYNMDMAATRTAPNSTYKVYDALFALEEGIITPDQSLLAWDHKDYPFDAWEQDQTLQTAMSGSVNWYFETLDNQMGRETIQSYIRRVGYGNETIGSDISSYWLESALKISPVEQVELLNAFYHNTFGFDPENIQAVKDSLRLSSSPAGTLYGKTGTGNVDGQDISGWFIGFAETPENTYFFATNIQSENNAAGSSAAEITLSILSDLNLWHIG